MYHPLIGVHALAGLRPIAWSHEHQAVESQLLAVPTRSGVYFLPPTLTCLQLVIESVPLTPDDLDRTHRHFKTFQRELYLLAAREELSQCLNFTIRRFTAQLRRWNSHHQID